MNGISPAARGSGSTSGEAREIARGMPSPAMIYAVTPEGWTIHVENIGSEGKTI